MTAAERQQRRRDKLAALKPVPEQPPPARDTREDAWDEACDTLQLMLEDYRVWLARTPAPATALHAADLPRLAAQVMTLAMTTFPSYFGDEWHDPDAAPLSREGTGLDNRTLRQQLFAVDTVRDPDNFQRTPDEDANALAWWSRLPIDSRASWQRLARSTDPLDVWYTFHEQLNRIR
jgi:hypothetical protein